MMDYSEHLIAARKALSTAEAAACLRDWKAAAEAFRSASEAAEQAELLLWRKMREA